MTPEELIKEIKQLSLEDKKALRDEIFQIVRDETQTTKAPVVKQLRTIAKPGRPTRDESDDSQESRLSVSERLHGILKFDGDPPNDEEVKDMIADYLIRKYS